MKRLPFFPPPFPDECFYSLISRYCAWDLFPNPVSMMKDLFGRRINASNLVLHPVYTDTAEEWLAAGSGVSPEYILRNNTAFGYFSICLTEEQVRQIRTPEKNNGKKTRIRRCRSLKIYTPKGKYLRYCPVCLEEDRKNENETYWRRMHQLPEVFICPVHKVFLHISPVRLEQTSHRFLPAQLILNGLDDDIQKKEAEDIPFDQIEKIVSGIQWLLENGDRFGGTEKVLNCYKYCFEREYGAEDKRLRIPRSAHEKLKDCWKPELLEMAGLKNMEQKGLEFMTPMLHMMFMTALADSPEGFYRMFHQ